MEKFLADLALLLIGWLVGFGTATYANMRKRGPK